MVTSNTRIFYLKKLTFYIFCKIPVPSELHIAYGLPSNIQKYPLIKSVPQGGKC